jgi:hypothetical protein
MTVYKLLHKPTGLYLCPARLIKSSIDDKYVKSNLSKDGKIYHTRPAIENVKNWYCNKAGYSHLYPNRTNRRNYTFFVEDIEVVEL